MVFALPADAAFGKGMVVTAYPEAYAAVAMVRDLGIWHRIEIEINHIIQCSYYRGYYLVHLLLILKRQVPE